MKDKKIKLRPYQEECIQAIIKDIENDNNSIVDLPTGAGKSIIISEVARRLDINILVTQPSVEIIKQNYNKLFSIVDPLKISIYSASAKQKEVNQYTLATIGSIKDSTLFEHIDLIISDECHTINSKDLESMYMKVFQGIKNAKGKKIKVIGLSATAYRIERVKAYDNGKLKICNAIKVLTHSNFWNNFIYSMPIKKMIKEGYLVKPVYKKIYPAQDIPVNKTHTEFDLEKWGEMSANEKVAMQIRNIKGNKILVFCSTIKQAEKLWMYLKDESLYIHANTVNRENIIKFWESHSRIMFNVGVLTTGFDLPEIDTVVLLRPTKSLSLYVQMVGRGLRTAPGKSKCEIVDMCGVVRYNGKIEEIKLKYTKSNDREAFNLYPKGKWNIITENYPDGIDGVPIKY